MRARAGELVQLEPAREHSRLDADASAVDFEIESYLTAERAKDLLRFSTAGSVDDGKSTLIGRLLYDTQSVYDDQVRAIEGKGTTAPGVLDLALLTDGLRAEREQGITIDVAYRYFSTARRKFIIADTPGHEQYTRNMATGASTADVAIVLVDARKGVLVQSRRHAYITALLGVRNVIVAVNKMDLVGYSEAVFRAIEADFSRFFTGLDVPGSRSAGLHFIPVSALAGDNVVHRSEAMPWHTGAALLSLLEDMPSAVIVPEAPFRMAVQRVVRPNRDFRGFAGQISAGAIRRGDRITVLPSGQRSRVARIVTFDGDLPWAVAPLSITLTLEDEIDISRGDLITAGDDAQVVTEFEAALVWMDAAPLEIGRRYLLKLGSRTVPVQVQQLLSTADLSGLETMHCAREPAGTLAMNAIGRVRLKTAQPVAVDAYQNNRRTGSFVLIDLQSNATVAAGMVQSSTGSAPVGAVEDLGRVSAGERLARYGHRGALLHLRGPAAFTDALERGLFERGAFVLRFDFAIGPPARALVDLGLLILMVSDKQGEEASIELADDGRSLTLTLAEGVETAVRMAVHFLEQTRVLHTGGRS